VSWEAALDELNTRVESLAEMRPAETETLAFIEGAPLDLLRKLISGYVPIEETDQVLRFLEGSAEAIFRLLRSAATRQQADAGLQFTVAQMVVLGVALGRRESRNGK